MSQELTGWAQIAGYFRVSERTVRNWEKEAGLPVHRLRRNVYARPEELDRWKLRQDELERRSQQQEEKDLEAGSAPWLRTAILVVLAIGVLVLWQRSRAPRVIADASVEGKTLLALDESGEVIWRQDFETLHGHHTMPGSDRPSYLLFDTDGDGQLEILFNYSPAKLARDGAGRLICFDRDREVRWEFTYGREITVGTESFEPFFGEAFVRVIHVGGKPAILTIAHHSTRYLTQVALVDVLDGSLLHEYWHPGFIYGFGLWNADEDAEDELLLGGVYNPGDFEPGLPALAVLDLPFVLSRSTLESDPNFFGAYNRLEIEYLLFEQPDVFRAIEIGAEVWQIYPQSSDRLKIGLGTVGDPGHKEPALHLYLNRSLEIMDVRASSRYRSRHNRLFETGLLDHLFSEEETENYSGPLSLETAPASPPIQSE